MPIPGITLHEIQEGGDVLEPIESERVKGVTRLRIS